MALNRKYRLPVKSFFVEHGPGLGVVVLIMLVVSLAQSAISTSLSYGVVVAALDAVLPPAVSDDVVLHIAAPILETLRLGLVVLAAILFLTRRKVALFRLVIAVSFVFTLGLLGQTSALLVQLFGAGKIDPNALMRNVVLMIGSNILIFSLWYWIIDPPGVERTRLEARWEFLFPQRGGPLPHYEDYLFLAFMTSFAFSPTDTLPLTPRAKLLMLLQASISVITLVVIASGGINILSGAK